MTNDLKPGVVITYPYLWQREADNGETEGRKPRPTCIAVSVRGHDGGTHLVLLAVTSQPPASQRIAIEVPDTELRRGGLKDWQKAWVIVDEYNYDVVETSYYLEPGREPIGRFSKPFMTRLATALVPIMRTGRGRVNRVD